MSEPNSFFCVWSKCCARCKHCSDKEDDDAEPGSEIVFVKCLKHDFEIAGRIDNPAVFGKRKKREEYCCCSDFEPKEEQKQ